MENFLGEFPVEPQDNPFAQFTGAEWAKWFLECHGQTDGAHHKAWVLDQIARVLHGTPVTVVQARWGNGESEYRCQTGEPSE